MPLLLQYTDSALEAGCDEAGRGCLAGPVFAAAVILKPDFQHELLNDSKQVSKQNREALRYIIETESLCWAVATCSAQEIDNINILNASILAMHRALDKLNKRPGFVLVDGNRFKPYGDIPFQTMIKGDGRFMNIAAASILAKTHRDEYMEMLHEQFPEYGWKTNAGYPTPAHRLAIRQFGPTIHHRMSFQLLERQIQLF